MRSYENGLQRLARLFTASGVLMLLSGAAMAEDWEFDARLMIGEIFTDNVNQDLAGEKESDLVTEVTPGISARRQGGRLEANIDYSVQTLHSLADNQFDINHSLLALSTAEILEDHLFLDADASIVQALISAEQSDDVFLEDRSEVITFGLSPYWMNDFKGYAEAEARYSYDVVLIEEGASDAEVHTVTLGLDNGRRFTSLIWNLDYFFQQLREDANEDENGDEQTRERATGLVRYELLDDWSLIARAGYEDNKVPTAADVRDGFFWSLGAGWNPSRLIDLTVLYGPDDREFSLRSSPSRRTTLEFGYLDREVGVNPESSWFGSLIHRTRYSTWLVRYTEESTNTQRLFISQPRDQPLRLDEDGMVSGDQVQVTTPRNSPGLPSQVDGEDAFFADQVQLTVPEDSLSLTDDEFFRKRLDASIDYTRGRSQFTLGAFYEDRAFEDTTQDEQAFGADAAWSRRIAPRTNGVVGVDWERTEFEEGNRQDDDWDASLIVTHTFTPQIDGSFEYRHIFRDSSDPEEEFHENRVGLFLTLIF